MTRLRAAFPGSSGRRLKRWLAAGRIRVNGVPVHDGHALAGPADTIDLAPREVARLPAALGPIYEDGELLVIDKPPGLLTIASEGERLRTAYRLVGDHLARRRPPERPFIVHRLDRETSGLLVMAKSAAAKRRLQAQFAARTVERRYVALVTGRVRAERGTLTSRLVEERNLRVRSLPESGGRHAARGGRLAITRYRVLERGPRLTLLELALGTGRRRQIRVQLADLGHPIVGDAGSGRAEHPLGRLCLHATRLAFRHPATGAPVAFDSPVPAAFRCGRRDAAPRVTRGAGGRAPPAELPFRV